MSSSTLHALGDCRPDLHCGCAPSPAPRRAKRVSFRMIPTNDVPRRALIEDPDRAYGEGDPRRLALPIAKQEAQR